MMTFVDPGGDGFSTEPTYATEPCLRLDKKTYFPHENEHENGKTTMNEDVFFQIKKKVSDFPASHVSFLGVERNTFCFS